MCWIFEFHLRYTAVFDSFASLAMAKRSIVYWQASHVFELAGLSSCTLASQVSVKPPGHLASEGESKVRRLTGDVASKLGNLTYIVSRRPAFR